MPRMAFRASGMMPAVTRRLLRIAALAIAMTGCGSSTGTPSPAAPTPASPTPASQTPAPTTAPSATPAATAAAPTPAPVPGLGLPAFPTAAAAHTYAAQRTAATTIYNHVVNGYTECPAAPSGCYILTTQESSGTDVASFFDPVGTGPGGGAVSAVYLVHDSAGWHWLDSWIMQNGAPSDGATTWTATNSTCANVRSEPSTTSAVVACLPSGSQIAIDQPPQFTDGHIWWHASDRHGWIAHDAIIPHFAPGSVS